MHENMLEFMCKQIRFFRKANKLSISELGERINKSKTTISKYESGKIDIDVRTLIEIAQALGVSLFELLGPDILLASSGIHTKPKVIHTDYYMYRFDPNHNRLSKSYISCRSANEGRKFDAILFHNVKDFSTLEECEYLYHGNSEESDSYLNFFFENQSNSVEKLYLVTKKTLKKSGYMTGILTGIHSSSYLPASSKIIMSENPLMEDDTLLQDVRFSKTELEQIKKTNLYIALQK